MTELGLIGTILFLSLAYFCHEIFIVPCVFCIVLFFYFWIVDILPAVAVLAVRVMNKD